MVGLAGLLARRLIGRDMSSLGFFFLISTIVEVELDIYWIKMRFPKA